MKKLTTTAAVLIAVATFVTSSHALTASQVQEIKFTVLGVPVPEMPAKAAELVTKAEKQDRQAVAVTAVRAVVSKHRAAAPLVVASISKAAPDLAPVVAVAAAQIVQDRAALITRAAVVAAPGQTQQIVSKVRTAVPSQAPALTGFRTAAAQQGPTQGTVRIDDQPINSDSGGSGDGTFPPDNHEPQPAPEPVRVYGEPQP